MPDEIRPVLGRDAVLRTHTLTPGGWECMGCPHHNWDDCPALDAVLTPQEREDLSLGRVTQESLLDKPTDLDARCTCQHWTAQHRESDGRCIAPFCECRAFVLAPAPLQVRNTGLVKINQDAEGNAYLYSLRIDGDRVFDHATSNVMHDYLDRYADAEEIIIRRWHKRGGLIERTIKEARLREVLETLFECGAGAGIIENAGGSGTEYVASRIEAVDTAMVQIRRIG